MRIEAQECLGLIIDVQERLLPHMHNREALERNVGALMRGLDLLGVPMILSEQYPKGLGPTVASVANLFEQLTPGQPRNEKISFSCLDDPTIRKRISDSAPERRTVVVAGIETHVCVLQTVVDLVAAGFRPVVVEDATSSRRPHDKEIAIRRVELEGGICTTWESLLFELCRYAGSETFKGISRLAREAPT